MYCACFLIIYRPAAEFVLCSAGAVLGAKFSIWCPVRDFLRPVLGAVPGAGFFETGARCGARCGIS